MADHVVPPQHPASSGSVAKKEESTNVNIASFRVASAGISYLIENNIAALMTAVPYNGKPYGYTQMASKMQAMFEMMLSAKLEFVDF